MEIVKISRVVDDIFLWIIIKCIDDYGIIGEYDKIVADNEDDDTNDDGNDDDDDDGGDDDDDDGENDDDLVLNRRASQSRILQQGCAA